MSSTIALFTGLSGLSTNSRRLDVIGNNIANVNTTAYKSNRIMFSSTFSRTFSLGTSPSGSTGGTNPGQIGLGVTIAGTQRDFANGSISATGVPTDIAVEGEGMFIVESNGQRFFTRDGSFQLNENNDLVSMSGAHVMGYTIDSGYEVVEGNVVDLNIPVGVDTLAEATENVFFDGNLNASGVVATTGSIFNSRALFTDAAATIPATSATDVTATDIYILDSTGTPTLALDSTTNPIITISGIEKGGKDLGEHSFAFSGTAVTGVDDFGTTLDDFTEFLEDVLGLDDSDQDGQMLGGDVSINAAGQLVINGNEGSVQDLSIESGDLVATSNTGGIGQPFVMSQTGTADGESVRTSYVVYDSLGTPLTIDLTFVLQETTASEGTIWTFVAESSDNDALDRVVGLGTVEFDGNGDFVSASNDSFAVTRENGAVSPLTVQMEFDNNEDSITALTSSESSLAAIFQDGSSIGTLSTFSIGDDGIISGSYTNGLTRTIGQIAIAKFANREGLVDVGNNMFRTGPNSGEALITNPMEFGTGRLVGGALELSNVDLSQEFINMILASTGYSAASRVITTTDELMDQLLVLGR